MEIERRFLIEQAPAAEIDGVESDELRQGYVALDGDTAVRVRRAGDACTLTIKGGSGKGGSGKGGSGKGGSGTSTGLARTEVEMSIDPAHFDDLWPLCGTRRIHKTRHRIPHGELVIELDVFADALTGLVIAEVEFDSIDAAERFDPPAWFGREVTAEPAWNNASLAVHGRPD